MGGSDGTTEEHDGCPCVERQIRSETLVHEMRPDA